MRTKNEVLFEQWLDEHGTALFRYAVFRVNDEDLAQDLVQETLLAAWRNQQSFADRSSVRTWLIGILKHKMIDSIRKQIRQREGQASLSVAIESSMFDERGRWLEAPASLGAHPEQLLADQQFMRSLQACLAALPELQKQIFLLKELSGENSAAICKQCGISSTNLHVLMHRARLALRSCLQNKGVAGR